MWTFKSALFLSVMLFLTNATPAQDVEFFSESPSKLKVRVVRVVEAFDGIPSSIMTLEVSNSSKYWAEPLEFLVPAKKRKDIKAHRIPRVHAPFFSRAGRAVAPGKKLRYVLSLPDAPKQIGKSKVKVTQASFFVGDPILLEPLKIGKIDHKAGENDMLGNKTTFSRVHLKNITGFPIEVIVQADFTFPKKGKGLVWFQLSPHEERLFTIDGLRTSMTEFPLFRGSRVKSLKLMDWSGLRSGNDTLGRDLLRKAYDERAVWPSKNFTFEAEYALIIQQYDWSKKERVTVKEVGRCISKGRFPEFKAKGGKVFDKHMTGALTLGHANRHFIAPTFEDWLNGGEVKLHVKQGDKYIVGVLHERKKALQNLYYWIEKNQIVQQARSPFSGPSILFENIMDGGEAVVSQETEQQIGQGPSPYDNVYRYKIKRVDGFAIPVEIFHEKKVNPKEQNTVVELKLSKIKVTGGPKQEQTEAAPQGELADLVRAAWNRGYRYPNRPMDVRGGFRIINPGNDFIWRGHKEVKGEFFMKGMSGYSWKDVEVTLDGDYTDEDDLALQETVRDRFGMFMGRDLSGRPSFEKQFAGAEFEQKGDKILVRNCPINQVQIRDGKITSYWIQSQRKLTWKNVRGMELLVRAEHGRESISFDRKEVDGVWLPINIIMKEVFQDWGPEQVNLIDLRVEPSK